MPSLLDATTIRDCFPSHELPEPIVVEEITSTNAVLVAQAGAGQAQPWQVLVAERQSAGRGRIDRTWESPAGAGVLMSVLIPMPLDESAAGWISHAAGLAIREAIAQVCGVQAALKWPNDVLAGPDAGAEADKKLAGILCELVPGVGVVVGMGVNVNHRREQLPLPQATSLYLLTGRESDRSALTGSVVAALHRQMVALEQWGVAPLRDRYRQHCGTVGAQVSAHLPGGEVLTGRAIDVDASGALLVSPPGGASVTVSAADVVHLRPVRGD